MNESVDQKVLKRMLVFPSLPKPRQMYLRIRIPA
jgi:hypothetical protein